MSSNSQRSFEDLPNEIIGIVASHCADAKDVLNLAKTCKSAKVAVDLPAVWMSFFDRQFDLHRMREYWGRGARKTASVQSRRSNSELEVWSRFCQRVAVALGRLDEPHVPDWAIDVVADLSVSIVERNDAFYRAMMFVVGSADPEEGRLSNNVALLKRMVASKRNHKRLFNTHIEILRNEFDLISGHCVWPFPPFFVSFLHLAFDPSISPRKVGDWHRLYELQEEAYSTKRGVFKYKNDWFEGPCLRPNLLKILSIAKLYRYHLLYNKDVCELTSRFLALEPSLRPSTWKKRLSTSHDPISAVGAHWIGTSSSMSKRGMVYLRQITESRDPESFIDAKYHDWCVEHHGTFADEDGFEEILFQHPPVALWPEIHQMTVPIIPYQSFGPLQVDVYKSTPNMDRMPLVGRLKSGGQLYLIFGHLSRITLPDEMRYHSDDLKRMAFIATKVTAEWPPQALRSAPLVQQVESLDTIDEDSFVYEGLVVPGDTMIFGQWRQCSDVFLDWNTEDPTRTARCGPFIMWNVPHATMEEEDKTEEREEN